MYFDGSVMKTGAGAGLLFISPLGEHMRYVIRLHFPASNNMAEYEALLGGLRIAIELGVKCLDARGDSQLVVDQVMKESSCHDPKMEAYCNAVRRLEDKFDGFELNHVPCKYNEDADELAKIASGRTEAEAMEVDEAPTSRDWRVQYLDWMIRGILPSNRAQARRLARRGQVLRSNRQ